MKFSDNHFLLFLHILKNEAAAETRLGRLGAAGAIVRMGNVFKELFSAQLREARHELLLSKMPAQTKNDMGNAQGNVPTLSEEYDALMYEALKEVNCVTVRRRV